MCNSSHSIVPFTFRAIVLIGLCADDKSTCFDVIAKSHYYLNCYENLIMNVITMINHFSYVSLVLTQHYRITTSMMRYILKSTLGQ